jgi:hypothetical protein
MPRERVIGLAVLLICIVMCLVIALAMDTTYFIPYNATLSVTQTWQSKHQTPQRQPDATGTPGNFTNPAVVSFPNVCETCEVSGN